MRWGGEDMQRILHTYVDRMGWVMVFAALIIYFSL
jgi:hypothetical protein